MRKKISERNVLPGTDLFNEYQKLEYLFSGNQCIGEYNTFGERILPQFTLEQYMNDLAFSDWNLKGTAISFNNMRDELGLSKEKVSAEFSTDIFVDFIELCLNCVFRINTTIEKHSGIVYISDRNLLINIIGNCKSILEKLNYTYELENVTNEIYIYSENSIANAVAETNEDIADSLIEYRRHDMKGDIKKKGEILCTLFKKLESVERKFKGTTYEKLASDTTFLFNKTGIRHWVKKDKIASGTFMKMDPDMLEKWYDNTYDLFLSCMVISSYLDMKKEIEEIKRTDGE